MNNFKKKAVAGVLVGCMMASAIPFAALAADDTDIAPAPTAFEMFTDVANHWGKEAVKFVVDNKIFSGTSATTFVPDAKVTREQMAVVLYNYAKFAKMDVTLGGNAMHEFVDIETVSDWAKDGIRYCVENGILSGIENQIAPSTPVTREQLMKMIFAFASEAKYDVSLGGNAAHEFADEASVSDWAKDAVLYCISSGIVTGKDSMIAPTATATRAEMATIMQRFAGLKK